MTANDPCAAPPASFAAVSHRPQHAVGHHVGEVGKLLGGRAQRVLFQQVAAGDAQRFAPLKPLEHVEPVVDVRVLRQQLVQLGLVVVQVRGRAVELAVQPVEVLRIADEDVAEQGRRPQQRGQDLQRAGIVLQVADERALRKAVGDVAAESGNRGIGVRRFGERFDQQIGELAQRQPGRQVVGKLLQQLVGGRGAPEPERREIPVGLGLREIPRQEQVSRRGH